MIELKKVEKRIIKALAAKPLTTEQLAEEAGYWVSGYFTATIQSLRKRGILGNNRPGYYIQPEYLHLLQEIEG